MTQGRVLVVEDNPVTRKVTRLALESAGYAVHEVTDARTALAAIRQSTPDIVLQDIRLPDMDGVELCRRLRQALGSRIPILAFTASLERLADFERNRTGFNDFLLKPLQPARLVDAVQRQLSAARTAPPG